MPISLRAVLALVPLIFLVGCLSVTQTATLSGPLPPGVPCASGGDGACFFDNAPAKLGTERLRLASRLLPYSTTVEELRFVDGARRRWDAPRGTLTDGASIPVLFQPFLGNPRDPLFVNAGVLHDAYCGIGNEGGVRWHADTWQNVHVMFFDALVVAGTPLPKAKVMFAAVWLGGPRWNDPDRSLDAVPDTALVAAFVTARTAIEAGNLSLQEIIRLLEQIEADRLSPLAAAGRGNGADMRAPDPVAANPPAGLPIGGGVGGIGGNRGAQGAQQP